MRRKVRPQKANVGVVVVRTRQEGFLGLWSKQIDRFCVVKDQLKSGNLLMRTRSIDNDNGVGHCRSRAVCW